MYKPTEKELLEMGFENRLPAFWFRELFDFKGSGLDYCYHSNSIDYFPSTGEWRYETPIYPRSKAHLEQIILAFKPE